MVRFQSAGKLLRVFVVVGALRAPAQTVSSQTDGAKNAAWRGVLDQYCVSCHNARLKTAGLLLDRANLENVSAQPELWERVVRKLRAGTMPPSVADRSDRIVLNGLAAWLEGALDAS